MDERTFHQAVDDFFMHIEDRIDELELDIDIDSSGGVLTLTMDDDSQVILSRQVASFEIWVAARSGGFHCQYDEDEWRCQATGETLNVLVDRVLVEQGGEKLS